MANYSELLASIRSAIRQNGNNEITGNVLQGILVSIVNSLGSGYLFYGVANPSLNPGNPDARVFYITSAAGTYTYFGGIVVNENELVILKRSATVWEKNVIATLGGSGGGIPEAPITGGPYGRQNRDWVEITGGSGVTSVNGRTGAVTIVANDIPTSLPDVTAGYAWELKPTSVVPWRQISQKPTILPDVNDDDKKYVRKYGQWVEETSGGGIPDAPDNKLYGRTQGSWREITGGGASLLPTIDIEQTTSDNWVVSSDVDLGNVVAELQNNTNNPITLCKIGTGLCMSCVSKTHIITTSSDDWKLVFEEANAVDTGLKRWIVIVDNRTENPNSSVSFEIINGSGASLPAISVSIGAGYEIDNPMSELKAIYDALTANPNTPVSLYDTENDQMIPCSEALYDGGLWKLQFKQYWKNKGYDYWEVDILNDGTAYLTQPIPVSYENLAAPKLVKRQRRDTNQVLSYYIGVTHPVLDIDKDAEAVLMVYRRRSGARRVTLGGETVGRTYKAGYTMLRAGYERRADTTQTPPIVSNPVKELTTKNKFYITNAPTGVWNLRDFVIKTLGCVYGLTEKQVFDSNGYAWWQSQSGLKGFKDKDSYVGYKLLGVAVRVPNPEFTKYANPNVVTDDTQEWTLRNPTRHIPRYFYSAVAPLKAILHSEDGGTPSKHILDFFFPQPK